MKKYFILLLFIYIFILKVPVKADILNIKENKNDAQMITNNDSKSALVILLGGATIILLILAYYKKKKIVL